MSGASELFEEQNHHPDIGIYDYRFVNITTHYPRSIAVLETGPHGTERRIIKEFLL